MQEQSRQTKQSMAGNGPLGLTSPLGSAVTSVSFRGAQLSAWRLSRMAPSLAAAWAAPV